MGKKKKNSASVIITIIITLVVLAALSYACIRYLLPVYNGTTGSTEAQFVIYSYAVKVFPLLFGLVLIVIASMIATSRDDEEDEDDKLPPNSYENQLYENPSDDPVSARHAAPASPAAPVQEEAPATKEPFVSIFDQEFPGEPVPEPVEEPVIEEVSFAGPADEPVAEEPVAEEPATEEPEAEVSAEEESVEEDSVEEPADSNINTTYELLMNVCDRLSEISAALAGVQIVPSEPEEVEEPVAEEPVEEPVEEETSASSVDSEMLKALVEKVDSISGSVNEQDEKFDKLCDAVSALAASIAAGAVLQTADEDTEEPEEPATEEVPAEDSITEEEKSEAPETEEPPVEEVPEVQTEKEVVREVQVVYETVPAEEQIGPDYEGSDAEKAAHVEFDSARDYGYDISFALTSASADDIALNMEGASVYEVNDKRLVVIPFLSEEDAKAELEKLSADYEITTVEGGQEADFDEIIGSKLR